MAELKMFSGRTSSPQRRKLVRKMALREAGWKWIAVADDFCYDYDEGMRIVDGDQSVLPSEIGIAPPIIAIGN